MADIKKARQLFKKAGLSFPHIPNELAVHLKEQDKWVFATRKFAVSPYNLKHYVREVEETHVEDYAVLSHSGHGVNSYALQYYLVYGSLRMFLHLGWGGVYMDAKEDEVKIADCFSLAAKIVNTVETQEKLPIGQLTIVGSDFYGGYWSTGAKSEQNQPNVSINPAEVLADALEWLRHLEADGKTP